MARYLWRGFQREIVHAELFHAIDTCQTVTYAIDSAHQLLRCFCHFSEANGVKVLDMAAIEDNSGTKMAGNGTLLAASIGVYIAALVLQFYDDTVFTCMFWKSFDWTLCVIVSAVIFNNIIV